MPSVDENSNTTDGNDEADEVMAYKLCECCPFGYHIDRDFVPFSEKMLSREGDVQKVQALKEKWRSNRQSMDKLLGIETESWEIKTLSRPNRDIWEFDFKVRSLHEKLAASVPPLEHHTFSESDDFTFGFELDQAVEEFEEVLSRAKSDNNTTVFDFPDDQKFHTFPRQKGRYAELSLKPRIDFLPTSAGVVVRHMLLREEKQSTATAPSTSEDEEASSSNNWPKVKVDQGQYAALLEQLQVIPELEAAVVSLQEQNRQYATYLDMETERRLEVEHEMNLVRRGQRPLFGLNSETESVDENRASSIGRKRTRDVSVSVGVTTRDVGVSHAQISTRSIGVGGRIDTGSLERDSSSPTGSVNGRRRGRNFEVGLQVNESELLDKESTPLLAIVEKCDSDTQTDSTELLTTSFGFVPTLATNLLVTIPKFKTKDIGITVKPITRECGVYIKPSTREGMSNTVRPETSNKGIGTMPCIFSKGSGDMLTTPPVLKSTGVNTSSPEMSTVASSTSTLFAKQSNAAQLENVEKHDVGLQINSTSLDASKLLTATTEIETRPKVSRSLELYNRVPASYRSNLLSHNAALPTSDVDSPRSPPIRCKPILMRSNTYTKDIPLDEELSPGSPEEVSEAEKPGFGEQKYYPGSFDLSIPTIPERREAVKPSKEMQGALKVLNDALLRGKTTEHVTSAIGIILHEWFRVSGSKSANALDVEDYLDLFENYSPELLKYIVNMPDGNGNSAIHYAVSHGNFDVVSVLLDSNCCDINRANKAGYTCIMLLSLAKLSYETDRHVVCRLCSLGDVNIKATQHGQTALMLAASHGRLETCKILLDAGADINIRDDDGSTALMCAAEHGHGELVNYFVTLPECDLHITDNDGSTALNVAMEANHKDIGVTLYAHMHLVESPKSQRRLSYPPASPTPSSPSPTSIINRSAGNSPGTKKKLRQNIASKEKETKSKEQGPNESA